MDFPNFDIHKIYLSSFILFQFLHFSKYLKHKRHFSWDQQASKKANSQSIDRKINGKSSTNNRFNTIASKTVKNVNKNSISNSILQMVSWCCYGCCCCYCCCCNHNFNWIQMFKKEIEENLSIKYSICLWNVIDIKDRERKTLMNMMIKNAIKWKSEWER